MQKITDFGREEEARLVKYAKLRRNFLNIESAVCRKGVIDHYIEDFAGRFVDDVPLLEKIVAQTVQGSVSLSSGDVGLKSSNSYCRLPSVHVTMTAAVAAITVAIGPEKSWRAS
jgi:hypothetical protein